MNLTHINLMLNHIPILGSYILFFLYGYGMIVKKESLLRASLWLSVLIAIATLVVYLTGDPAAEVVKKLPGISDELIENHENIALVALCLISVLGIASLYVIKFMEEGMPSWMKYGFLAVAFSLIISISWVGYVGGLIRHPEGQDAYQSVSSDQR